jgi:hypothetical protein
MSERQDEFGFDTPYMPAPAALPELRDEIARTWGLPLGERVEVSFRGGERAVIAGVLELADAPAYPWDNHESLKLRIAGLPFSSREIERWIRL